MGINGKRGQLSILIIVALVIVAGIVGILFSIGINEKGGIPLVIVLMFSIYLLFGYIESRPELKSKIKEMLKI